MSSENPFEKSVWDLLEGDLSAEQFRELEATLLQSEEGRARFLEIADLHDLLHQKLSHSSSEPSVISMDEVIKRQQRRILKRSALAAAALLFTDRSRDERHLDEASSPPPHLSAYRGRHLPHHPY